MSDIKVTIAPRASTSVVLKTGVTGATGPQGLKGDTGAAGTNGSDASVTSANITSALGYTPASPTASRTSAIAFAVAL